MKTQPNLDSIIIPKLRKELTKLESKKEKEKDKGPKGVANCVNEHCKHKKTINLRNKNAYSNCFECGGYEHFQCAGIKDDQKNHIKENMIKFFCSGCLIKNPLLGID